MNKSKIVSELNSFFERSNCRALNLKYQYVKRKHDNALAACHARSDNQGTAGPIYSKLFNKEKILSDKLSNVYDQIKKSGC